MTGVTFSVEVNRSVAQAGVQALMRLGQRPGPLLRAIGVGLVRNTQDRFDDGRDPEGNPWAPLNAEYASGKRGPGILRESGMRGGLQGSITSQVSGEELAVGTNKIYGAIHQFGGVIRPKKAAALVFRMGGRLVIAREVTIPARPYLGVSAVDEDTIMDVVELLTDRALAGAAGTNRAIS
jgi:phage virion morphogenesis protein